jgi:hypothetical protein
MLSVLADCHRCLNNSMSSKNLKGSQSIRRGATASRADEDAYQVLYPPI